MSGDDLTPDPLAEPCTCGHVAEAHLNRRGGCGACVCVQYMTVQDAVRTRSVQVLRRMQRASALLAKDGWGVGLLESCALIALGSSSLTLLRLTDQLTDEQFEALAREMADLGVIHAKMLFQAIAAKRRDAAKGN